MNPLSALFAYQSSLMMDRSDIAARESAVCISHPADFEGGAMFDVISEYPCECGLCSYHAMGYSQLFHQEVDGEGDTDENESILIPVHEACFQLYEIHLSSRTPFMTKPPKKGSADTLARLVTEYEIAGQEC
jgi:hypothetical protein